MSERSRRPAPISSSSQASRGTQAPAGTRRAHRAAGATAGRRRRGPFGGCLGRILLGLLLLAVLGLAAVAFAYARTDIPNANALASSQVSIVYFDDGKTEIGRISSSANRESVSLDKVPVPVQRAFLAAEDRSFYDNRGISPSGIARAVWVGLRGGETQGGSTITQQYVKNYFLTSDQTWQRKIKEIFISVKIDQQMSKEEVLRDYLNTIYFGRGAYGIQTASKAYFDKDVSQLTPAEGAVLASIVRGPSLYDPSASAANKKRNTDRANWILDGMVQLGWLPAGERAAAVIPDVVPKKAPSVTGGTNGYLVSAARGELVAKAKLRDEDFERGGLRITTSISADQQEKAVAAVQRYAPDGEQGMHFGLAAVRPGNGEITAMYGGPDFLKQQFNDATQGAVPGASTFKAFTLTAAIESGLDTKTQVNGDMPYRAPGMEKGIDNSEGEGDMGYLTLKQATAQSVNTAFARLNIAIGPEKTADVAGRLGIRVPDDQKNIVGNTLGVTDVTPVQEAAAYAAYAAKGRFVAPHIVRSAKNATGSIDYTASTDGKQVIDEKIAADVVDSLQAVVKNGTATRSVRASGLTRPVAGKTGTGERSTSAWFTGFVPQLAASVSMYQLDDQNARQEMRVNGSSVYGGGIPTKIWSRFMYSVIRNEPVEQFPEYTGQGRVGFIGRNPSPGNISSVKSGAQYEAPRRTATPSASDGSGSTSDSGSTSGSGDSSSNGATDQPSSTRTRGWRSSSSDATSSDSGTSSGGSSSPTDAGASTAAAPAPSDAATTAAGRRGTASRGTPGGPSADAGSASGAAASSAPTP